MYSGASIGRDMYTWSVSLIAQSPNDGEDLQPITQSGRWQPVPSNLFFPQFGSCHIGIADFLYGDGSVHSINVTTNADVLRSAAHVSDGGTQMP
jgi:hypothetical protein